MNNTWRVTLWLLGAVLIAPIAVIYASWLFPQAAVWQHLIDTVLLDYVTNSLLLALGTGCLTLVLGTTLGWLVARYDFVGRRWVQWWAVLPLAMPAYITAYTYTGLLDFAGPVHLVLAQMSGVPLSEIGLPDVRSLSGAILLLGLVLYPYVFLLARTAFQEQSARLEEVSASLGSARWRHFVSVTWPLARPAVFAGTLLTMMEALADYGTVAYFGVNTFTTGIFRTWFGLNNALAAAQLAALLCTMVFVVLVVERYSRRHLKVYASARSAEGVSRQPVSGGQGWGILLLCFLPALFGFFIPVMQLLVWAWMVLQSSVDPQFWVLAWHSLLLALGGALLTVLLALFFSYSQRLMRRSWVTLWVQIAGLGYAIPGTVIGVGVLLPLIWLDHQINDVMRWVFDWQPGLVLSGSVFALLLGYSVRFLTVALQNTESGLARITPSMDEAALVLGERPAQVMRRVHLPLMRVSLISAVLLVFVDILKELPATLILRPFNFNTLAVRTFELASDERLVDAALPALSIVLVGLIPVVLLTGLLDKKVGVS